MKNKVNNLMEKTWRYEKAFLSVDDWFDWGKDDKRVTLEDCFFSITHDKLGWEVTDVLYSFLGIYLIGVYTFYKENLYTTDYCIMRSDKKTTAYSFNYLESNRRHFTKLNELEEMKEFLNELSSIGNIIPVFPGSNVNRGVSYCFDLPEIYFMKYPRMARALDNEYNNGALKYVINNENSKRYSKLNDLFSMTQTEYKEFLRCIVDTIKARNSEIIERVTNRITSPIQL